MLLEFVIALLLNVAVYLRVEMETSCAAVLAFAAHRK